MRKNINYFSTSIRLRLFGLYTINKKLKMEMKEKNVEEALTIVQCTKHFSSC